SPGGSHQVVAVTGRSARRRSAARRSASPHGTPLGHAWAARCVPGSLNPPACASVAASPSTARCSIRRQVKPTQHLHQETARTNRLVTYSFYLITGQIAGGVTRNLEAGDAGSGDSPAGCPG